jgi:hypothetical protein
MINAPACGLSFRGNNKEINVDIKDLLPPRGLEPLLPG